MNIFRWICMSALIIYILIGALLCYSQIGNRKDDWGTVVDLIVTIFVSFFWPVGLWIWTKRYAEMMDQKRRGE